MKLKLVRKHPETSDVTSFVFEGSQPMSWEAGQYIHYTLPQNQADDRGISRWFTVSSAPFEKDPVITTRFAAEHGSTFKQALAALPIGSEIEADDPEGDFTLDQPERNHLWLAGGIGITPFHSILAQADHEGQQPKITLLYANKTDEVPFRKELDEFAARNPNLQIEYITGSLDAERIQGALAKIDNPYVYVSGPEPMVEALADTLKQLGVSEPDVKTDYFPGYEA